MAAAVVAVSAGALVPNLVTGGRPAAPPASTVSTTAKPTPPLPTPTPNSTANDPVEDAVFGSFPAQIDGAPLLRSFVVPSGKSTGSFTVSVPAAGVGYVVQCLVPDGSAYRASDVSLVIRENGEPNIVVGCESELGGTTYLTSEHEPAAGTARIGLQLTAKGKPFSSPSARIAVGVYSSDYPTRTKDGFTVPKVKRSAPNAGTLHSFDTLTLTPGRRELTVEVPASTKPIQITYLSSGAVADGTVTLTVPNAGQYMNTGGGTGTVTVPAGPARTVTLAPSTGDKYPNVTGKLAIVVYLSK